MSLVSMKDAEGNYTTDLFKHEVWNNEVGRWTLATEEECINWNEVKQKKRVLWHKYNLRVNLEYADFQPLSSIGGLINDKLKNAKEYHDSTGYNKGDLIGKRVTVRFNYFCCTLCNIEPIRRKNLERHLRKEHNLENDDIEYYLRIADFVSYRAEVWDYYRVIMPTTERVDRFAKIYGEDNYGERRN